MESDLLEQRRFSERRTIRLLDNAVELSQHTPFGGSTVRFPYEQIPEQTLEITTRAKVPMFIVMVLALFVVLFSEVNAAAAWSIAGGALIVIALQWRFGKRDYVGFDCAGRYLLLLARTPSEDVVRQFLQRIRTRKAEYLKKNYAYVQPQHRPVDELHRLTLLLQQGAISASEFALLKGEIMTRYSLVIAPEPDEAAMPN